MPYVRRSKKRTTMRRYRKRFNIARKVNIRRNAKVNHLLTRRFNNTVFYAGSDINPQGGVAKSFALSDLTNYTEFTALFDQYQITGIQYRFVITINPDFVTNTAYRGIYPLIRWVHDHDDASAPATEALVVQYPKMHEFNFAPDKNVTRWFYLKPAIASQAYGSVFSGYSAKWRQFLDSGYPGTPHYGIKAYCTNVFAGMTINLETRYVLKFKSVI